MKLSLASWSFPRLSLREIQGLARAVDFDGIDVGLLYGSALAKERVLKDPNGLANELLESGVPVASYYHLFGEDLVSRHMGDARAREENLADFLPVAQFCAAVGADTLFVLPGVQNPGQTKADALDESAETLRAAVDIVGSQGVTLTVEPHVGSLLESPAVTLDFLATVPGLRLALDYSHFVCLGFTQEAVDVLLPHAANVQLRQARAGRLQERFQYGTINFNSLLGALTDLGYDGWVMAEALHQEYIDSWNVDVMTENLTYRDIVRAWQHSR